MNVARAFAPLVLTLVAGCAPKRAPPPSPQNADLGGHTVARVGDTRIASSLVAGVASARGIAARDALGLLIDDALAAEGAHARGLDVLPPVAWASIATRARMTSTRLRDDALGSGPPSDDEIAQLTEFHWLEYDLPEQVRVVHAVVKRPENPTPDAVARAREVAADILTAVARTTTPDEFQEKAKAVPHAGADVIVQTLPPFVDDGRVANPSNQRMHLAFVTAAFALKQPGAMSGVVESPSGWHVIRLVERLPAKQLPLAERRALLTDEVYVARARGARESLLARLRASQSVQISPAAESTMASIVASAL